MFTTQSLNAVLQSMDPKKACGPDNIEIEFLRQLSTLGRTRLLRLLNKSYAQGQTPAIWRKAEIISIGKPGKPGHFRPISLTNSIARVMERLALDILVPWIEPKLPPEQAAFRQNRSCDDQIIQLVEEMAETIHQQKVGMCLFLDFSAAYDRVSKPKLLTKLGHRGCPNQLLTWIRSFVNDRRAYCRWDGSKSKPRVIPNGLPQGSSMAPTLWNAFTMDFPSANETRTILFADDTALYCTGATYNECLPILDKAVQTVERYCKDHDIQMNPTKTVLLPFGNKPHTSTDLSIEVGGSQIHPSPEATYLGVVLDSKLQFKAHTKRTAERYKTRNRILACLAGKSWGADEHTIRSARNAFVEPLSKYAAAAWVPHTSTANLDKIETARNTALRIQTGCCTPTPIRSLRQLTGTDSLRAIATKQAATHYEKTARMLVGVNMNERVGNTKLCRRRKTTTTEIAEHLLAQKGLLPVQRTPISRRSRAYLSEQIKFHYSKCNKNDPDRVRKAAAESVLNSLPSCDIQLWTDGSVIQSQPQNNPDNFRLSVQWDEKWYTGKAERAQLHRPGDEATKAFSQKHGFHPTHTIKYDDGDVHAAFFERREQKN